MSGSKERIKFIMSKYNILIIEDHELTRFGLKTTFEGVDFVGEIYEASSAEKGIEIVDNFVVDSSA